MQLHPENAQGLLEVLAIQEAASVALPGTQHDSRLAKLPLNSWQAGVLAGAAEVGRAETPDDLRKLMANPDPAVIFLPQTAMVTADIIERICRESSLGKFLIWETET